MVVKCKAKGSKVVRKWLLLPSWGLVGRKDKTRNLRVCFYLDEIDVMVLDGAEEQGNS